MKTTKKGFTLIELIVVIAIIGVLAAILIPSMLGYVKKSKVSSANSAANSLQKAINTCLVEIDEESQNSSDVTGIAHTAGDDTVTVSGITYDGDAAYTKIHNYMEKIQSREFDSVCDGGVCIATAIAIDSKYTGTAPGGIVTVDNYTVYSGNVGDALTAAEAKARES